MCRTLLPPSLHPSLSTPDAPLYIIQGRLLYAWEKQLNKEQGQEWAGAGVQETNVKL